MLLCSFKCNFINFYHSPKWTEGTEKQLTELLSEAPHDVCESSQWFIRHHPQRLCHYVSALFKTAATLKGKKLPSLLPLCSLWLKLTSVERARIPSLVSIYHPGDSQEHISEKPGNRSHTEDYLDHISPGFLFPSCFLGHTGRLQRPFRRAISYVKLASWVDSCTSDSLLPLHLFRSGPTRLIKSQILAHQWHDCLGLQI